MTRTAPPALPPHRTGTAIRPLHLLLALLLVAVWGTNFVVIHIGLAHLPPLLFAALRFVFAVFPAILFIKRPRVSWRTLATYGLLAGACQFGFLYIAMRKDISPGLASLVLQTQVFMTIALAVFFHRESVKLFQIVASGLAAAGLALIAVAGHDSATPLGLMLVLLAAGSWAASNLVIKRAGTTNMVAFIVWASAFSAPALVALALVAEGWHSCLMSLRNADAATWLAVAWQSGANTLFGYSVWGWLLTRYPAATITPVALLIPVFGLGGSALIIGETLPAWKIAAASLVIGGLAINIVWPTASSRRTVPQVPAD